MKYEQIDEINNKIIKKIKEIEQIKSSRKRDEVELHKLNVYIQELEEQKSIIYIWYLSHSETPPTEKEREQGEKYLEDYELESGGWVYAEVINWFNESYATYVPQAQFTIRTSKTAANKLSAKQQLDRMVAINKSVGSTLNAVEEYNRTHRNNGYQYI